jgi:hypothetical protein
MRFLAKAFITGDPTVTLLKSLAPVILIVIALLALSAFTPKPGTPPLPLSTLDGIVTLEGEVNGVADAWNSNGDGGIVVDNTFVSIVGGGSPEPTVVTLKVRYINDLFHHKVRITGTRFKSDIIAKTIEEL